MTRTHGAILLLTCWLAPTTAHAAAPPSARALYERALEREAAVRSGNPPPTAAQVRQVITAYETVVRRFPASGYCDNALWQAANLALLIAQQYGQDADKREALRLLAQLKSQYPASSLASRADELIRGLNSPPAAETGAAAPASEWAAPRAQPASTEPSIAMIRGIKRTVMPEGTRVIIEMDAETSFRAERLENPRRVFFDLKSTRAVPALLDKTLKFKDSPVREIRLGRHPQAVTRVVFDMDGVDDYSVFTLYNPYRLIVDFKRAVVTGTSGPGPAPAPLSTPPLTAVAALPTAPTVILMPPAIKISDESRAANHDTKKNPDELRSANGDANKDPDEPRPAAVALVPPAAPAANSDGKFSLSRQLGLGISRVVIDAGHGGHDPGAQSSGINEAELTLDVALRLSKLLQKQPGVEVVMTRDTDVFVPLEERTAIANREGADLFLSIHANASRSPRAHGVETYFLNFAMNPEAEAVAARENSASGRAMHSLPDIVKAIALNNKIDESRDFAEMVQRAMVGRLATRNKQLKDLGVKQAPFVVLIGAAMPSVLAEISFVTHKQEGQLLRTSAYRQQIAEALLDAVVKYQQSLKKPRVGVVGLGQR
jgi:N-acetylmuramoyl-L-alanine amidase